MRSRLIGADTVDKATILGPYDLIFIDGGHSYETVKDLIIFDNLENDGVIVIHDIFSDTVLGVPKYWKEIKKDLKKDIVFTNSYDPKQEFKHGIGVVVQNKIRI